MTARDISMVGRTLLDRRGFLGHMGTGVAGMALADLLARGGDDRPHHEPRAKQLLMIFCSGALSHVDTFDYKPELIARHGKPLPGGPKLTFQGRSGNLARPLYEFRRRGQCGKRTSDLLPRLGAMVDEMCFIHSMQSKTNTHGPGENVMSTGFRFDGFPSLGAWLTYALGSDSEDLPSYVAIPDPRGVPQASVNNWGAGFLPAVFQGTPFNSTRPIRNLSRPKSVTALADRDTRELLRRLNEEHLRRYPGDSELAARIASHELAARMQLSVPEIRDLSTEPASELAFYGADDPTNTVKASFARNCILARRLIERGVRFVQLFNGAYAMGEGVGNWDGHKYLKRQYDVHGPILDQPVAALLADLKRRGLLDDTLVVFCTEFGRMPTFQHGATGRDHNPDGFTCWLAGAGVKAPFTFGATDDFGHRAAEDVVSVHDFHATILHLLGLDHERLTFYHDGIQRRLTDVAGRVVHQVLA
jgi:Protein of unknown function (DUF1501)